MNIYGPDAANAGPAFLDDGSRAAHSEASTDLFGDFVRTRVYRFFCGTSSTTGTLGARSFVRELCDTFMHARM